MSPRRVTDRYDVTALPANHALVLLLTQAGQVGSIYQLLKHIPEQAEEIYTVLVDTHAVVTCEVSREAEQRASPIVSVQSLEDYRRSIGQGHDRIRLDTAIDAANAVVTPSIDLH